MYAKNCVREVIRERNLFDQSYLDVAYLNWGFSGSNAVGPFHVKCDNRSKRAEMPIGEPKSYE
ncbi:hypothetical protein Q670_01160 [Alcanivorax sp. P2S70]|nr:hypothetical protein Q670_01160 [Alcanivorax sp. P2S70]